MQVLRHSQITVTMQVYSEVPSDAMKDALRTASMVSYCCTKIKEGQSHDRNRPLSWAEPRAFEPLTSWLTPLNAEDFVKACRAHRSARPDTTSAPVPPAIELLPPSLEAQAAALRGTEQFRATYEPFGATFARVPLAELVTPQWWVDTEYVQTLTDAVPAKDDLDGMFRFSFATGRLVLTATLAAGLHRRSAGHRRRDPPAPELPAPGRPV